MLPNLIAPNDTSHVDLTNCDRELIHLARAIQPHGCLLVIEATQWIILQASANTEVFLGLPFQSLLGKTLDTLLNIEDMAVLCTRIDTASLADYRVYVMSITSLPNIEGRIHVFANRIDGLLLLEFERAGDLIETYEYGFLSTLSSTLHELRKAPSMQQFLNLGLAWLQGFTRFDRVMVYRFNQHGSGTVLAEAKRAGLEPFLGLHYPASDIPAPAHRLFSYSPLRHLPDVDYVPIPMMVAEDRESTTPLDMSYLFLRSVSTMYTGYLRNMGVKAAVVMPLVMDNTVWGVISCLHHTEPRYLSYEKRVPVEFLAQSMSRLIRDREELENYEYRARLDNTLDSLMQNMSQREDIHVALMKKNIHLLSELGAEGVALLYQDRLSLMGKTPDRAHVYELVSWLTLKEEPIFSTHRLWQEYPASAAFGSDACGILSIRLSQTLPDRIIWFRSEAQHEIHWAGNPQKPVEIDNVHHEIKLLPRTSFTRWIETVQGESLAWLDCELDYADRLRQALSGIIIEHANRLAQIHAELVLKMDENIRIMEDLKRHKDRLSEAQHRARLGYWDFDIETRRFNGSDELCRLYGMEPGEFAENLDALQKYVRPDDLERLKTHFNSALSNGSSFEMDLHIIRLDGQQRVLNTVAEVVFTDGSPCRISGTSQDISERRQTEDQLNKLALAVEQSPESIMITDLNARIEYVNQAFTQHSGYTREEAVGQNTNMLNAGQTAKAIYKQLWETIKQGNIWEGEFINKRKDGTCYMQRAKITPLRQPDGRITHYIAVQEDISEQKRLATELEQYRNHLELLVSMRTEELRRQSRFLRVLIDNLPHLVWLKDIDGRILATNKALAELHGLTPDALIGKSEFDLLPTALATLHQADEIEVMTTGRHLIREKPLAYMPDTLYETYLAPVVDDADQVLGTVGFARDTKPQRLMEAELAQRVRQAEAATRAKSAFLANMSHEIRTPLTAILGFSESLQDDSLSPEERDQSIHTIIRNGRHLQELIANILDFSKIEAEQIEIEQRSIDFMPFLADIHALGLSLAQGRRLTFSSHLLPPLPAMIQSDPTRLKQILINLIGNAVKFTSPPGVVRLIVSLDRDAEQLVITIQDTGIGIAQEDVPHLFKSFVQADVSITRRFGGTGLGLSISRKLARQLGGDIQVCSIRNLGSAFIITVATGPLDEVTMVWDTGNLVPRQVATEHSGPPTLFGRILVAEDNPDNQKLISLLIRRTSAEVVMTSNGQEALDQAQIANFDLILMDMQMPVMGGLEAAELLRLTGFEQPIIALTANATKEDRTAAESVGCNDFLTKPIDQAAFFATLERYLPKGNPSMNIHLPPSLHLDKNPEYIAMQGAFFQELPERLHELQQALAVNDWPALKDRLHQLKGIAGSFGLPGVSKMAGLVEAEIKSGDYREVPRLANELFAIVKEAEKPQ